MFQGNFESHVRLPIEDLSTLVLSQVVSILAWNLWVSLTFIIHMSCPLSRSRNAERLKHFLCWKCQDITSRKSIFKAWCMKFNTQRTIWYIKSLTNTAYRKFQDWLETTGFVPRGIFEVTIWMLARKKGWVHPNSRENFPQAMIILLPTYSSINPLFWYSITSLMYLTMTSRSTVIVENTIHLGSIRSNTPLGIGVLNSNVPSKKPEARLWHNAILDSGIAV